MKKHTISRRDFLKSASIGALGLAAAPTLLTSCGSGNRSGNNAGGKSGSKTPIFDTAVPELLPQAPDGRELKAGLIGCGGRGTGAALNFVAAGSGLKITKLADIFDDKMASCRAQLAKSGIEVPDADCFVGFDAYKQVIDSDVDVVLLCTPPVFRHEHFKYCVEKGKHVFMEKPCSVDPVGARSILLSSKIADQKRLSVVSGTIRRSQKDCVETFRRVKEGAIGDIVSAQVLRNGSALWFVRRQPGWSDMEYMMRNWVNFCWSSGDHIVEQFIHEIDMMSWFMGDKKPVRAVGYGSRQRRVTGDMYDNFSVQYEYETGLRAHCSSRQINGCSNEFGVMAYGTDGFTNCFDTIFNLDGSVAWKYPTPAAGDTDQTWAVRDPYEQEHIRLVTAIRTDEPFNDAELHVQSTVMTIMGRISAYTGRSVSWDEVMASEMNLGFDSYSFNQKYNIPETIPIAGTPAE